MNDVLNPADLERSIQEISRRIHNGVRVVTEAEGNAREKRRQYDHAFAVAYTYQGPEGDSLVTVVAGEASDLGDSAVSKAMSVALRIAHTQMLQIPTGESDPADKATTRGTDPLTKVKTEIWEIAERKGWISEGDFTRLAEDFSVWSQGGVITEADLDALKDYKAYLKPPTRMRRPGGEAK